MLTLGSRLLAVCVVLSLVACASAGGQRPLRQPLLAGGHGVDHVTILTEDVDATAVEFAHALGFTVGARKAYGFGFTGANIYFADHSYIELYGIHDPAKVTEVGEGFAIDAPPGVRWVTLHTRSAQQSADLLRARGIPAWGPFTLPEDSALDAWTHRLLGPEQPVLPGGRVYFVEYNESLADSRWTAPGQHARETHANGAVALKSVWIAVRDLTAAAARYEAAGLIAGPEIHHPALASTARAIQTPGGTLLLVQASHLQEAGEDAFYGISIRTTDLDAVRAVVRKAKGLELAPYDGLNGRSILVAPSIASGVAIEFFE